MKNREKQLGGNQDKLLRSPHVRRANSTVTRTKYTQKCKKYRQTHTHTHTHTHACTHTHTRTHACMYVAHTQIHKYRNTYTHAHLNTHTSAYWCYVEMLNPKWVFKLQISENSAITKTNRRSTHKWQKRRRNTACFVLWKTLHCDNNHKSDILLPFSDIF